jgi:hypothetical protein
MPLEEFKKAVIGLKAAYENAVSKGVSLAKPATGKVYDFKSKKEDYYRSSVATSIEILKSKASGLSCLVCSDYANAKKIEQINDLLKRLDDTSVDKGIIATKILAVLSELNYSEVGKLSRPKSVPQGIRGEVMADIDELEKCFNSGCLRSAVILCGRLLEIALHRKYFEVTGNDALEKSPGIGLGNLIAKLRDKNVELDPALTNQVHLINQVRISSVHVKKEAFRPSQQQAQAIVLYTLDVLDKIFA